MPQHADGCGPSEDTLAEWRKHTLYFWTWRPTNNYNNHHVSADMPLPLAEVERLAGRTAFARLVEELERRCPLGYESRPGSTPISYNEVCSRLGREGWKRIRHIVYPPLPT